MKIKMFVLYMERVIGGKVVAGTLGVISLLCSSCLMLTAQGLSVHRCSKKIMVSFVGLIFYSSVIGASTDSLKYETYEFKPVYGERKESYNTLLDSTALQQSILPYELKKINYTLDLDEKKYILASDAIPVEEREDYIKRLIKEGVNKNIYMEFTSLVSLSNEGAFEELVRSDIKRGESLVAEGHPNRDYLNCVDESPLFVAPLFDNKDFLFFITSAGWYYTNTDKDFGYYNLNIYNAQSNKKIWHHELLKINYQRYNFDDDITSDYWFPAVIESPGAYTRSGNFILPYDHEGRKRYAKLFISDFDKNNKLDILVWNREYASAKRNDAERKGFYLDKQWFELYEENRSSDGFNEKALSVGAGNALLAEHDLEWNDGCPNVNLCKDKKAGHPYMMYIQDTDIDPMAPKPWRFW